MDPRQLRTRKKPFDSGLLPLERRVSRSRGAPATDGLITKFTRIVRRTPRGRKGERGRLPSALSHGPTADTLHPAYKSYPRLRCPYDRQLSAVVAEVRQDVLYPTAHALV